MTQLRIYGFVVDLSSIFRFRFDIIDIWVRNLLKPSICLLMLLIVLIELQI